MVDQVIPSSPVPRFPWPRPAWSLQGGPVPPLSGSVPFPRSYWVFPGKLMAGCYPGAFDSVEAEKKLKGLLEHGIRHVIKPMEPDEFNWDRQPFKPYEGQMKAIADSKGFEVTFERVPIRDGWVSAPAEMVGMLNRVEID